MPTDNIFRIITLLCQGKHNQHYQSLKIRLGWQWGHTENWFSYIQMSRSKKYLWIVIHIKTAGIINLAV